MHNQLKKLSASPFAPAGLLALVAVLAYGLLLPQQGFYWDDLPMSWIRYHLGAEAMARYFSNNRPVWGWLYQLTTRILPHVPIYWQLFALLWRWVDALLVWAVLREIWPRVGSFAVGAALLFLVYPGFNAQWTSYLYSHFFIVLAFLLFSLLCTVRAIRRPLLWLTAVALIFSAFNLWMMEYFYILELARGPLIWFAIEDERLDRRARLQRTLRLWSPYLILFALAIASRLFIFNNQVYGFGLLPRLREDLIGTSLSLLQNAFISFWTVSIAAWGQIFRLPNPAIHGPRTIAVYGVVILIVVAVVAAYLWSRRDDPEPQRQTGRAAILLGLIMLPLASAPFWLIDLPVTLGFPANRFTLPSMLGVSLILGGALMFLPSFRARNAVIAVLVGMAVGRQFLWATDFARDWDLQRNLFWQMTWRAPALAPGTVVLMNERLEFYADNSLSAALNWIYTPVPDGQRIDYVLLYPTNRLGQSLPALEPEIPIRYDFLAGYFEGTTTQVVALYFSPPACLHLLDAELDPGNRFIQDESLMREAAVLSSASHVLPDSVARMPGIYGTEPAHGWCYFFQKADLARQAGDWEEVTRLGDKAFALDDHPNDPTERFVFIEGYAHAGNWAKAVQYSGEAHRVSPAFVDPLLCQLWRRIETATPASTEKAAALIEIERMIGCPANSSAQ